MGMFKKKKEEEFVLEEGQVVEVEFDKELVKEFKEHEGEVLEGTGAEGDDVAIYGTQTTINEDPIEELVGEGAEIEYVYKED